MSEANKKTRKKKVKPRRGLKTQKCEKCNDTGVIQCIGYHGPYAEIDDCWCQVCECKVPKFLLK